MRKGLALPGCEGVFCLTCYSELILILRKSEKYLFIAINIDIIPLSQKNNIGADADFVFRRYYLLDFTLPISEMRFSAIFIAAS